MKLNSIQAIAAGAVLAVMYVLPAAATETAQVLYKQCNDKQTTVEQRECYQAAVKQSEAELVAAEKKARADLVELEKISEGSKSLNPVKAFDNAERAYLQFRTAESQRVMTSYGSGNGGDIASYQTIIEMNIMRTKQLSND